MRDLVKRNLEVESRNVSAFSMFKQLRYFCLSMTAILLSMCFPAAEIQFLVLSIVTGAKWVVDSRSGKTNIVIVERRW